jgi:hypothetical protein
MCSSATSARLSLVVAAQSASAWQSMEFECRNDDALIPSRCIVLTVLIQGIESLSNVRWQAICRVPVNAAEAAKKSTFLIV